MKKIVLTAAALSLLAAPAQAQLLGGSGGTIGGTLGGQSLPPSGIGDTLQRSTDGFGSTARGSADAVARTEGSQSVDRRSGNVQAQRSADAGIVGNIANITEMPGGSVAGTASQSAQASGQGEAQAQLVGTDAIRGVAGEAVGDVRDTADSARGFASAAASEARDRTDAAAGSSGELASLANSSADGSASALGTVAANSDRRVLAAAGSAAAQDNGALGVAPGMNILSPNGERLGRVRQLVTDGRGKVQQVLVDTSDGAKTIPAADLSANGNALIDASGNVSADRDETSAAN